MKKKILFIITTVVLISCSSGDSDGGSDVVNTPPVASNYIAPLNNQTCTGVEVATNSIQVNFEWNDFSDAEDASLSYIIRITNLSTEATVVQQNVNSTTFSTILDKGEGYSWNITATDSDGETTSGSTWQFQTPFDAVSNYTPFPATLISPANGSVINDTTLNLTWEGNDPDSGETPQLIYDVYLSNTNPPVLVSENQTQQTYSETLNTGIYYWKIVSKDPNGNTSDSQVWQVVIN